MNRRSLNQKVGAGGTALTYEEAKAEMIAAAGRYWLDPDEEAAYAAKALADLPAFSAKLDEALEPHNAEVSGAGTASAGLPGYAAYPRSAALENEMTETKEYSDETTATGTPPLPDLSPRQQAKQEAFQHLDDIEAVMGGRNGPSIQLRVLIESLAA